MEVVDLSKEQSTKVMAVEILRGKPYLCLALRPSKVKKIMKFESKGEYLFDIFKADFIFYYLLKHQ